MRASDTTAVTLQTRSARFFETDGQWYFNSREGIRFGGYASKFDAELAAHLLFARVSQADDAAEVRTLMVHFMRTPLVALARPAAATNTPAAPEQSRWQIPALRRWFEPISGTTVART